MRLLSLILLAIALALASSPAQAVTPITFQPGCTPDLSGISPTSCVAQSVQRFSHLQPMKLIVEIATKQQGSSRYFCGVDFLTSDNQTYGGTWQESPNERDFVGIWQGLFVNEGGYGQVLAYKKLQQGRFYAHTVEWQPPLTWKLAVNGKSSTIVLPAVPQYGWQRSPFEGMHVGLYAVQSGVCHYRNLQVTGVLT